MGELGSSLAHTRVFYTISYSHNFQVVQGKNVLSMLSPKLPLNALIPQGLGLMSKDYRKCGGSLAYWLY